MEFGDYIRSLRTDKKLSMRELERRSGLSQAYISQLESGNRKSPKPETIQKLAAGLNIPYLELMQKAGYGEAVPHESLIEAFRSVTKSQNKLVSVLLPAFEESEYGDLIAGGELSEEELKRRLFDLKDLLQMDVDLYYDRENLSKEEREKIQAMLKILLHKED